MYVLLILTFCISFLAIVLFQRAAYFDPIEDARLEKWSLLK